MILNDKQIADRLECKLTCAINSTKTKGIVVTYDSNSKAVATAQGMQTYVWDYKRRSDGSIHSIYGLNCLLIGSKVKSGDQLIDLCSIINLKANLCRYIDLAFRGNDFADYRPSVNSSDYSISRLLFTVGINLNRLI